MEQYVEIMTSWSGIFFFFLWWACNEILPTRANLFKKKIVDNPLCPICGLEPETAVHILWTCNSARDVWCVSPRRLQKKGSMLFGTFFQLMEDILTYCDQEEIKMFVGIARRLWLRRNDVVHEKTMAHPNSRVHCAAIAMEKFIQANDGGDGATVRVETQASMVWKVPGFGWNKMNWDASIAKDKHWMGFGMVLHCYGMNREWFLLH
jgi:hypothetical protein